MKILMNEKPSYSGWQKNLYNLVTTRIATSVLDKMMDIINKNVPDDVNPDEVKNVVKQGIFDYLESVF